MQDMRSAKIGAMRGMSLEKGNQNLIIKYQKSLLKASLHIDLAILIGNIG